MIRTRRLRGLMQALKGRRQLRRKACTCANYPNVMIREGGVTLWYFVLWHMARNTVADAHLARWRHCRFLLRFSLGDVACKAFGVIRPGFADEWLVGIVAGNTSDTSISILPPAATLLKPIRLKADARNPDICGHLNGHVRPGSMTSAAKVDRVGGWKVLGVHDGIS
jgi:hypothetical protein